VKEQTIYIADDGSQFDARDRCAAYEDVLAHVRRIMAPIPDPDMEHGTYVQHDPDTIRSAKLALLRLAEPYTRPCLKWVGNAIDAIERCEEDAVNCTWTMRAIDECAPNCVASAWTRLCRIDPDGRDWQQIYFRLNPDEGEGEADLSLLASDGGN